MTIGERLRRAIARSGLTQHEVALRAGIEDSTVTDIVRGKTQRPSFDSVERIVNAIGIPFSVLFDEPRLQLSLADAELAKEFHALLGRIVANDAAQKAIGERNAVETALPRTRAKHDKVRDLVPAPAGETLDEVVNLPNEVIPEQYLRQGARRAYRVITDAMVGAGILEDSVIYVRPSTALDAADGKIIVCRLNRTLYLKRLDRRGGQTTLHNANPRYASIHVKPDGDKFEMIGVVFE